MITSSQEYLEKLWNIQDKNFPRLIPLNIPEEEPKLEIDLNKRSITAPEFLSVEHDHNAETVYFIVDRYFDNTDLATTTCIIQYKNADPDKKKSGFIYAVPQYYLYAEDGKQKMVFPWVIEGPATAFSGEITFSVRFYRVMGHWDPNPEKNTLEFEYLLNTLSAKSKVLTGLDVLPDSEYYTYEVDTIQDVYHRIKQLQDAYQGRLKWTVL